MRYNLDEINVRDRQRGMAVCAVNACVGVLRGLETATSILRILVYGGYPRSDGRPESGIGVAVVLGGGRG